VKSIFKSFIFTFLFLVLAPIVFAQESPTPSKKKAKPKDTEQSQTADPAVMDFESDVIEGQRMRPELFNQSGTEGLTLDAILYLRNDFNDLHQLEQKRRPKYLEKKKGN